MTPDLDALLAPVPGDEPAGPDLTYDPQRQEIEQAFDVSVSIDASGVEQGSDVGWRAVIAAIAALALRTKDVWLPVYLCRAGARAGSLATVTVGARALAGSLDTYWADIHPRLEDYGFQGRKGACDTLASYREFIGPLGRVALVEHDRLGRFTADDVVRFHGGAEAEDGYGLFRAALEGGAGEDLAAATAELDAIADALRRVDETLMRHAGEASGTNFTAVYERIDTIRAAIRTYLPQASLGEAAAIGEGGDMEASPATPARTPLATIKSRDDVLRAFDLIIDYYRRAEPSSPVPIMLERGKTWVNGDFLSLLRDIVPGAADDARTLLGGRGGG